MAKTPEEKRRAACEATRRWLLKHPDYKPPQRDAGAARRSTQEWGARNPEKLRASRRKSDQKRTERRRAADKIRHATPKGRHPRRVRNALKAGYAPPPHELDCPPRPAACQCCGKTSAYALQLDHDHNVYNTLEFPAANFRGWICKSCNMGLGKLGDDSAGIARAAAYLRGPGIATYWASARD